MFRNKPPLKTYQRRKAGGASSTFNPSFIVREDISDDKELQPQEFLAFKDSDKSLEYDPFDTTFDRLARDTKMPPVPQNPSDNSFCGSSNTTDSSSDNEESEPLPDPLPLINPRPVIVRRNNKRQRLSEEVATARLKQTAKRGRRVHKDDSGLDENIEPNSKQPKLGKRGRNKRDTKEARNAVMKKKRRVAEKPAVSPYSERRGKNLDTSESIMDCRVRLTRVDAPLERSVKALTLKNINSTGEEITDEFVNAEPEGGDSQDDPVENGTTSAKEKSASEFKNPTVLLKRLNVPQSRPSTAGKIWLNSTPIDRRTTRPKSLYRFSPIRSSTETADRNEDGSYDGQNLPSEKPTIQSKDLTPRNSRKLLQRSSRGGQKKRNSTKNRPGLLTDSPDPEPSGLMFEDSEIPNPVADSHASLAEDENKNATEVSSAGPFMGFSRGSAGRSLDNSGPSLRVVLAPIGNRNDVTDASNASPFKGFAESTESESLKLTLDANDRTGASSGEFSRSLDETSPRSPAPSSSIETLADATDAASFGGSAGERENDLKTDAKNRPSGSGKSAKDRPSGAERRARKKSPKKSAKASRSSSQQSHSGAGKSSPTKSNKAVLNESAMSAKQRRKMLEDTVSGLHNIFKRSAKKRQERLSGSAKKLRNDLHDSSKDWQNASKQSAADRQEFPKQSAWVRPGASKKNTKALASVAKNIAKNWASGAEESVKDTSEKLNSDDEWATIPDSPGAVSLSSETSQNATADVIDLESVVNVSSDDEDAASVFVNARESSGHRKFGGDESSSFEDEENVVVEAIGESEERGNENASCDDIGEFIDAGAEVESIDENEERDNENASCDDIGEIVDASAEVELIDESEERDNENASCDDIAEIVDASASSSHRKFGGDESSSFEEVEDISTIEAIGKRKVRNGESSVLEILYNEKLRKDPRRSSVQPIVLLTRLNVPVRKPRQTLSRKKARTNSLTESIESIQQLNLDDDEEDPTKLANDDETAGQPMERSGGEEYGSQESQGDMGSLEVLEESGNTTENEESTIGETSERDLSKGSFRWSMTEVEKAGDRSPKRLKVDDGRSGRESLNATKLGAKTALQLVEPATGLSSNDFRDYNRRSAQPVVLLSRLHDPIRITDRRRKYRDWGLTAITESLVEKNNADVEEEPENLEVADTANNETKEEETPNRKVTETEPKIQLSGDIKTVFSLETTESCDPSVEGHESIREDKIVYLKPGKSWSRSLSLVRQVNSQIDIESLARGKGKKWRQSVQSILDMQTQGVIQSCFKKNEDYKESRSSYGVRDSAAAWIPGGSQPDTSRVFSQTSVGSPGSRFVRRVSIRVVPDGKNSERYEDSPFLEAYGITSSQNRKTIHKRSTLIAPRKTLVYNVQLADVTFENIPKGLSSVTSRDVVLAQCEQDSSLPFDECYPHSYLKLCRKIGEGVFGEVFLYEEGTTRNVIKIIPIEGELKVNGERQKKFDEILSEIVIAKELNNLRFADTSQTSSFVEVKNIRCVAGKYPEKLIDLWKTYDDEKNSENDCPDMFDDSQLYIVLELGHGGQDLEAFVFQNSSEAHALFVQTALALAVAEESLEFEHRDLHWGNVLISRTEDAQIEYKLRNKDIRVASKGVKVSVIDFTLSRMSYQGCSIFNDLSLDDDLFAAQGEYQFEIYRLMRQKVENNWQRFEPYTNVLWLHYTLDKMITAVRYRRTASKVHKSGIDKLKELKNVILSYNSAYDFVTNCDKMTRLQGSRSSVSTIASGD